MLCPRFSIRIIESRGYILSAKKPICNGKSLDRIPVKKGYATLHYRALRRMAICTYAYPVAEKRKFHGSVYLNFEDNKVIVV
jgi:hypothetical protein